MTHNGPELHAFVALQLPRHCKFILVPSARYRGAASSAEGAARLIFGLCQAFLTPILAGRNEAKLKAVADTLGFQYRAFELSDSSRLDAVLPALLASASRAAS